MPSKSKKQSKTLSRVSSSDQHSSPRTPSLTPSLVSETSDEDLMHTLEKASVKYPSLIGKTAFIGQVTDIEQHVSKSKGYKIWLSESSMVASGFAPGSLVSVICPFCFIDIEGLYFVFHILFLYCSSHL